MDIEVCNEENRFLTKVILFEPNPKCLHRIKTSIHLNNFQNRITINPFAVGAGNFSNSSTDVVT